MIRRTIITRLTAIRSTSAAATVHHQGRWLTFRSSITSITSSIPSITHYRSFHRITAAAAAPPPTTRALQIRYLHDDYDDFDDQNDGSRVYIHPESTLEEQANLFIDVPIGTMHPKDLVLKSRDLILDLCRSKKDNQLWIVKAEEVLFRLLDEKRFSNQDPSRPAILINADVFESVMFGWGKTAGEQGMERMRILLEQMKDEDALDQALKIEQPDRKVLTIAEDLDLTLEQVRDMGCQPTVQTYKTYLVGLQYAAKNCPLHVKEEALMILDEMELMANTRGYQTMPNTKAYTQVLTILCKTKLNVDKDSTNVFQRMKKAHRLALEQYHKTFGVPYDFQDPTANKHQIVTPDAVTYTTLIMANAGNTYKVEKIMKDLFLNPVVQPDVIVVTSAIDAFAKSVRHQKNPQDRARMARKAEEYLWMFVESAEKMKSQRGVDVDPMPNIPEIIHDHDNDHDTEEDRTTRSPLTLTAAPFNAALNAWAQSDVKEAAEHAQRILDRMLTERIVKPDLTTFNTVMNAWSRAIHDETAPTKVAELLALVYDMVESKELYKSDRPDRFSYASLIMAWSKSKDPESAWHARNTLNDQVNVYLAGDHAAKPSIVSYTGVLTAACHTPPQTMDDSGFGVEQILASESKDPYRIAVATYMDIVTDPLGLGLRPDHVVFAQMLQAILNHNDPRSTERHTMARHVWDAACAAGECSALVVRALIQTCPGEMLTMLGVTKSLQTVDQLPSDWIRNVSRLSAHRVIQKTGNDNKKGGGFTGGTKGGMGSYSNNNSTTKGTGSGQHRKPGSYNNGNNMKKGSNLPRREEK